MADRNRHLDIPPEKRFAHALELIGRELEQVRDYWGLPDAEIVEILEHFYYCYSDGAWGLPDDAPIGLADGTEGGAA